MLNFIAISILLSIGALIAVGAPIAEVQAIYGCSWRTATKRAIPAIFGVQVVLTAINPFVLDFVYSKVTDDGIVYPMHLALAIVVGVAGCAYSTRNRWCVSCGGREQDGDSKHCTVCKHDAK